jgi:uncharacterized protein YndB with AHSA1/START domain
MGPEQIWFGSEGLEVQTREISLRTGALWRFDMVVPDGTHDDDPSRFRMLVTFDEQSDSKTILTLRQMHPSKAQRDGVTGFGADEYGGRTLAKLARHVAKIRAA